ncbi:MAG: anaerobic sulfatase maturase [bacterium]|nr:anaerobic sulfatase maturase [bacterium]
MAEALVTDGPRSVHVMAKPSGAICNIDCTYCFYLEKEKLYPEKGKQWKMDEETLEQYVRHYIDAQDVPEVNFAWQGGEPTLMGVEFFRKAVALQAQFSGGKTITNAFQTNATLMDDEWAEFLAQNRFLVGVSIDGPKHMHDHYRVDKGGKPTFDSVMRGVELLKKHRVEFNTLTVLQAHNAKHPLEVYNFLKSIGSQFLQFIPIVERVATRPREDLLTLVDPNFDADATVSEWSVSALQYGRFLTQIFEEWVRKDVGSTFVQIFDVALGAWLGQNPSLCIFAETCGDALIIEHNGDLYSCDHYVYPDYNLGNIHDTSIRDLVASPQQRKFGTDKRDTLPRYCRDCDYRFSCNGGCPKHRFIRTPDGEKGLNYFCKGYKMFFDTADPYLRVMAGELSRGRPASGVMAWVRERDREKIAGSMLRAGRNEPCPCGSGKKFKQCHGRVK